MMTAHEIANALYGLKRLLRLDPGAVEHFGNTPQAFWNSFWVAVWVLPIHALQSIINYTQTPEPSGPLSFALVELFTYVIAWVLFPLVMVRVSDWLDRWPNYFHYLTIYNWFAVVTSLALLPAVVFGGFNLLPALLIGMYFLGIMVAFLVYGWWMAVHALKVSPATAVGIVLLDSLLSIFSMQLTAMAFGGA